MKKILALLFCVALLTSAYGTPKKFKTGVILNNVPFTRETAGNHSKRFQRGEKVYWLFMSKKPIKARFIKIQIVNVNHKTGIATVGNIVYTHEYKIDKNTPHYFTDYVVMHTPGHYYMQIFDMNQLYKPLVIADFFVR